MIQFEELICTVSLNEPSQWTVQAQGKEMVKKHIVQGYCNKVFFAAEGTNAAIVYKLQQLPTDARITKTEVFKAPNR